MKDIAFAPEEKLLRSIQYDRRLPLVLIIPTIDERDLSWENATADAAPVAALRGMFSEYYGKRYTKENGQLLLINMFHEPLRNAMEHGNKFNLDTFVVVGIWMGKRGILFVFRDHGDYFSKEAVKTIYESRQLIESTRTDDPGGYGCVHLYEAAEDIVVATAENTLYATYVLRDPE